MHRNKGISVVASGTGLNSVAGRVKKFQIMQVLK